MLTKIKQFILQELKQEQMRKKHNLKSSNELQKQKRFMFAQEIRKRDRYKKMQQIRIDFAIRQRVDRMLSEQCIDTYALNEYMKSSKINEMNAAIELGQWLKQGKQKFKIQNFMHYVHWAFILSGVIQYKHQAIKLIMTQYFPILLHFSLQTLKFEPLFSLLSTVLSIMQITKLQQYQKQQICQMVIINSQLILQKLPQYPLGNQQLKFYTYCHKNCFKIIYELAQNNSFLLRLAQILQSDLFNIKLISNAIRLINIFIYYDEEEQINLSGVSVKLIKMGLLKNLNFLINFLNPSQYGNILINIILALSNLISIMGIQLIFEQHLFLPIINLFDVDEYPMTVRIQACKLYMEIITCVQFNTPQLKHIRMKVDLYDETNECRDPIALIIYSLQNLAKFDKDLSQNIYNALYNLLQIGSQQYSIEKLSRNPYLLRLEYQPNYYILHQMEQFEEMVQKFKLIQGKNFQDK